jgi:hypothetical protein
MANAVLISALLGLPGFVCIVIGSALSLREVRRSGRRSALGIRFSVAGASLMFLVPGLAIIVGVVAGIVRWPAIIAAIPTIGFGLLFLRNLRTSVPS